MEPIQAILLNPNTVYLILVFGLLLTIMALLAPGTTILELLAFFTLLLAGYGIYNLSINAWALVILLLGVILFFLAVRKFRQPVYLVLSIVLLILGSVYIFPGESWWQPGVNPFLATVVSLLVGGYVWVIATKAMEVATTPPAHNINALIGMTGEAKTDIQKEGSVQVDGELWSAQSNDPISQGSMVRVVGREGFILRVEAFDPKKN
jgi:membrane-bound serine protease (ClpP class)